MKRVEFSCKGTVPGMRYTREEGAALLCEFQDEIIRDYRSRFNKDLINRKYFTKDLQAAADAYGLGSDRVFLDLKKDLDKVTETISTWWSSIAGEERAKRVLARILPGEEMEVLSGITLQSGREHSDIDSVVVTPYGVFLIEVRNFSQSMVWDEKGYIYPDRPGTGADPSAVKQAENLADRINTSELMLRNRLKDHMNVPYYSILLVPDNKVRVTDRYGRIPVSSLSTVLSDIRGYSDGRRHISSKEMQEIKDVLKEDVRPALVPCPVDCIKIAEEYSRFVSMCSGREEGTILGKLRELLGKKTVKRPDTRVA